MSEMDKKLYFISREYLRGEGTLFPLFLTKHLAKNGWHVRAVMASGTREDASLLEGKPKDLEVERIPVFSFGVIGRILYLLHLLPCASIDWAISAIPQIVKFFREERVVYATYPPLSNLIVAYFVKRKFGYPLCVDFRDEFYGVVSKQRFFFEKPLYRWIEGFLVKNADLVTVTTETVKRNLVKRHGIDARQVHVVLNGYYESRVPRMKKKDKFTIIYAGALAPVQKPHVLIEAYCRLAEEHPEVKGRIKLRFFGRSSRYSRRKIERFTGDDIEYCGTISHDEILGEIAGSDVAFFSLADETYSYAVPTKFAEYVQLEKPVLAALPEGEAERLIRRYGIGEVVDISDVKALADKIYLLYSDKKRIQQIKRNLSKHKEKFSAEKQAKRLSEILSTIQRIS